ncbi:hypothetical protein GCM10020358_45310 [Amorphoplanes nipponensis]
MTSDTTTTTSSTAARSRGSGYGPGSAASASSAPAQSETSEVVEGLDVTSGAGETGGLTEATAVPTDAYTPVSQQLGAGFGGSAEGGAVSDEAGAATGAQTTTFEESAGWSPERSESEQLGADEATAIDAGVVEAGSEEFFPFLAPLIGPLLNIVGPVAAKALGSTVAPALLQGLGSLFNRQQPRRRPVAVTARAAQPAQQARRETGEDFSESLDLDQESIQEAVEQLEVIIGKDDRRQITNTREVPWKRIVQLTITAGNGRKFLGSGALIAPRVVITAGHCAYMHTQGGYVREIQCTPGRNGDQKPYGTLNASRVWVLRGWTVHRHRDCDIAAVILPRPFSASDIGTFGFANLPDLELMSSNLNLAGYPGDKPLGTLWYHGRTAKSVTGSRVFYDIDTFGAQSGSPVWVKRPDNKRYMVAIHTTGSMTGNSGVRINRQIFQLLKNWQTNPDG